MAKLCTLFGAFLVCLLFSRLSAELLRESLQRSAVACNNKIQLSPINFAQSKVDSSLQLFDIDDNDCDSWGLSLENGYWNFDGESDCTNPVSVSYNGQKFNLKKIELKTSSEHSLGSGTFDGELQLHHTHEDSGKQLVLVLWLDRDELQRFRNAFLASLLAASKSGMIRTPLSGFGIYHHILPIGDLSYLTYSSSIAPSTCDEDTTWIVMVTPVSVPDSQFKELLSALSSETNGQLSKAFLPRTQMPVNAGTKVRLFQHEPMGMSWEEETTDPQCRLIAGTFAICMQVMLCVISITSLIIKRFLENPRRTWKIWFFDVSKQGFGAGFIHVWNMVLAVIIKNLMEDSPIQSGTDECALYAMNLSIDIFIGTVWLYFLLKIQSRMADHYNWKDLIHLGQYGNPPQTSIWLKQLGAYFLVLLTMKTLNATLILSWRHHLDGFYSWIFGSLQPYPKLELIVVMVVMPASLNVIQYWIVDNFLKDKKLTLH